MNNDKEIRNICPSCSPEIIVWHKILKTGSHMLIKCINCNFIHLIENKKEIKKLIKSIISFEERSLCIISEFNIEEELYCGLELILEDYYSKDKNIYTVVITSLESNNKRVYKEKIENINTIWCRSINKVSLKYSIQDRDITKSITNIVDGNKLYNIGNKIKIENKNYKITCIKERNGKFYKKNISNPIEAKNIKRIFLSKNIDA